MELLSSNNANYSLGYSRKSAREIQMPSDLSIVQGSNELGNSLHSDVTNDIHANGNATTHAKDLDADIHDIQTSNEEGIHRF